MNVSGLNLSDDVHQILADLDEDFEKFANAYCMAYAEIAEKELYKKAKECIQKFYEWKPKKYNRTYNLRDHSIHRYRKLTKDYGVGGVRISADTMKEYPEETYYYYDREGYSFNELMDPSTEYSLIKDKRTTDPALVANAAWVYGIHGINHPADYVTSPSPLQRLLSIVDSDEFKNDLDKKAYEEAKKVKYKIIEL